MWQACGRRVLGLRSACVPQWVQLSCYRTHSGSVQASAVPCCVSLSTHAASSGGRLFVRTENNARSGSSFNPRPNGAQRPSLLAREEHHRGDAVPVVQHVVLAFFLKKEKEMGHDLGAEHASAAGVPPQASPVATKGAPLRMAPPIRSAALLIGAFLTCTANLHSGIIDRCILNMHRQPTSRHYQWVHS